MKKRHLGLAILFSGAILGGTAFGIANNVKTAKIINSYQTTLKEGETEESKIKELEAKIVELMNNTLIKSIVSYTTSVAGIAGFIITLAKYRKYKSLSSTEIAELVSKVSSENLTAKYEELETKVVNELIEKFGNVEEALNIVQKIVIMAQNKTTKGQAALLEYLSSKVKSSETISEEVKEAVEEVKESVTEEVKKEEEVKEAIQEEYKPIE